MRPADNHVFFTKVEPPKQSEVIELLRVRTTHDTGIITAVGRNMESNLEIGQTILVSKGKSSSMKDFGLDCFTANEKNVFAKVMEQ